MKANHTVDAYWIGTRYAREEGKLYCEFDAKDAESIRQVLAKAKEEIRGQVSTFDITLSKC